MSMTHEELRKWANEIRANVEELAAEGNLLDLEIIGHDADGYLLGYGVYGSANITLANDCIKIGAVDSDPFTDYTKHELEEFRHMLDNC